LAPNRFCTGCIGGEILQTNNCDINPMSQETSGSRRLALAQFSTEPGLSLEKKALLAGIFDANIRALNVPNQLGRCKTAACCPKVFSLSFSEVLSFTTTSALLRNPEPQQRFRTKPKQRPHDRAHGR
jgi:hypothetical protein